jgi:sec-independent protein translocase protein TatA
MPNIGLPEIIIVLVIALVIFGPKRLPDLGKSLGKGMREFKDSVSGDGDDEPKLTKAAEQPEQPQARKAEQTAAESKS